MVQGISRCLRTSSLARCGIAFIRRCMDWLEFVDVNSLRQQLASLAKSELVPPMDYGLCRHSTCLLRGKFSALH